MNSNAEKPEIEFLNYKQEAEIKYKGRTKTIKMSHYALLNGDIKKMFFDLEVSRFIKEVDAREE